MVQALSPVGLRRNLRENCNIPLYYLRVTTQTTKVFCINKPIERKNYRNFATVGLNPNYH